MIHPSKFGSLPALHASLLASLMAVAALGAASPASAACGVVASTTGIRPATAHAGASSGVHAATGGGGTSSPCGSAGASAAATVHSAPGGGIAAIHALASPNRASLMTNAHATHTKTTTAANNVHSHAVHSAPAEKATPKPKT